MTEKILAIKEFKQAHYDELMLNDANVVNRETRKSLTIPLDPPAALHFMPTQPIRGGGGMHVVAHPPNHIVTEMLVDGKPTDEEVENSALPFGIMANNGNGSHTESTDATTIAMKVMIAEMDKNKSIADLVEMKLATEEMLTENKVLSAVHE